MQYENRFIRIYVQYSCTYYNVLCIQLNGLCTRRCQRKTFWLGSWSAADGNINIFASLSPAATSDSPPPPQFSTRFDGGMRSVHRKTPSVFFPPLVYTHRGGDDDFSREAVIYRARTDGHYNKAKDRIETGKSRWTMPVRCRRCRSDNQIYRILTSDTHTHTLVFLLPSLLVLRRAFYTYCYYKSFLSYYFSPFYYSIK